MESSLVEPVPPSAADPASTFACSRDCGVEGAAGGGRQSRRKGREGVGGSRGIGSRC
jgi:hypothetical protein